MKLPCLWRPRLCVGRWTAGWHRGVLFLEQAPDPRCVNCHGAGGTWTVYESGDADADACWCWHPGYCLRLSPTARRARPFSDEPPF
ncbi:hypothetical protein [Streptomyces mayteni]